MSLHPARKPKATADRPVESANRFGVVAEYDEYESGKEEEEHEACGAMITLNS